MNVSPQLGMRRACGQLIRDWVMTNSPICRFSNRLREKKLILRNPGPTWDSLELG